MKREFPKGLPILEDFCTLFSDRGAAEHPCKSEWSCAVIYAMARDVNIWITMIKAIKLDIAQSPRSSRLTKDCPDMRRGLSDSTVVHHVLLFLELHFWQERPWMKSWRKQIQETQERPLSDKFSTTNLAVPWFGGISQPRFWSLMNVTPACRKVLWSVFTCTVTNTEPAEGYCALARLKLKHQVVAITSQWREKNPGWEK